MNLCHVHISDSGCKLVLWRDGDVLLENLNSSHLNVPVVVKSSSATD